MKHYLTLLLLLAFTLGVHAQTTVQWASRVAGVSSEFTELGNSARQALYKPNILPSGGDNPNTWRPYKPNTTEYITVDFDLPMLLSRSLLGKRITLAQSPKFMPTTLTGKNTCYLNNNLVLFGNNGDFLEFSLRKQLIM